MSGQADLVALVTAVTALLALVAKVVSDIVRGRRTRAAELAAAPHVAQKLEADLAEQAQRIYTGAIGALEERFERAEEEHSRQLGALRVELKRMQQDRDQERRVWELERSNLHEEIKVLTDALRDGGIPVPMFARRTA